MPGGGGMGSPRGRDPDAVRRDVRLGYVSREAALRDYGVTPTLEADPPKLGPLLSALDVALSASLSAHARQALGQPSDAGKIDVT